MRPVWLGDIGLFVSRQLQAAIFGIYLLSLMLITAAWYPLDFMHRYDFIFLAAIVFQVILLVFRLESLREAAVILVFHVLATVMEIFKTSHAIGSWQYPEPFVFGLYNVPLFAGFMYSAIGSYIARIWRLLDFQFSAYPPLWATVVLVLLIYLNFFTHHYIYDIRWLLAAASLLLFGRTFVHFTLGHNRRAMPLLPGWIAVALMVWVAENISTYANIWIYPSQRDVWQMVSISKIFAWYLLMMLSFVMVSFLNRPHDMSCTKT